MDISSMATCGPKGHEYSWGHACMPPPLWHPWTRIVTCYLYEKSHYFSSKSEPLHRNAPRPPMGDWWRKRGALKIRIRFSAEQKNAYHLRVSISIARKSCPGRARKVGRWEGEKGSVFFGFFNIQYGNDSPNDHNEWHDHGWKSGCGTY